MDNEDTKRGNDEPTRERPEAPDEDDQGTTIPIADQPPKKYDDGPEQGIAELPPEPPPHGIAEPAPPPPGPIADPPPEKPRGPRDAHDRDEK